MSWVKLRCFWTKVTFWDIAMTVIRWWPLIGFILINCLSICMLAVWHTYLENKSAISNQNYQTYPEEHKMYFILVSARYIWLLWSVKAAKAFNSLWGYHFILKRCYISVYVVHVVMISPFTYSRYPWLSITIVILKFSPTGVTST